MRLEPGGRLKKRRKSKKSEGTAGLYFLWYIILLPAQAKDGLTSIGKKKRRRGKDV